MIIGRDMIPDGTHCAKSGYLKSLAVTGKQRVVPQNQYPGHDEQHRRDELTNGAAPRALDLDASDFLLGLLFGFKLLEFSCIGLRVNTLLNEFHDSTCDNHDDK